LVTVLLVEDERVTRRRIQKILEEDRHTVVTANNGSEALDQMTNSNFDVVLLDDWMPEMNGLELLDELKKRFSQRPKVVVITADDTPQTLLDAVKGEAYQLVSKPVQPEQLLSVIDKAARDASAVPPIRVISAKPHWIELAVPCDRDTVDRIQSFLSRLDAHLEESVREAIGRVFREMLLNAVEWGGKLDPTREVRVTYLRAKRMILYRIADPGEGFRLDEIDHAAVANPGDPVSHVLAREAKGLRPGGFGIMMSQSLADELLYNEAQNEVVFVKYLDEAPGERL
jgi:CheY-like chemotaxis protein/anti-sigma regulatory factor (Ser/Thr protein kinase)